MRPSFPGLPDREPACRGSEPEARPSSRHLAALMETAVRLRTDSHGNSEDGGVGGRAPGPAPSPSPTPAAALLQVSPYLADLQLAGKGLWGMWGVPGVGGPTQPTSPATATGGPGGEQRGTQGKWGSPGIPLLWPQTCLHPRSVDSVTQAPTRGQEWPQVLGRPHRPLPQEAQSRERCTRNQQAKGWGVELQSSRARRKKAGRRRASSVGGGQGGLQGGGIKAETK